MYSILLEKEKVTLNNMLIVTLFLNFLPILVLKGPQFDRLFLLFPVDQIEGPFLSANSGTIACISMFVDCHCFLAGFLIAFYVTCRLSLFHCMNN